jgi:hypothetical protein
MLRYSEIGLWSSDFIQANASSLNGNSIIAER